MIVFGGIIFGLICIFTGFILHHGNMMIFAMAWTEFIVIGGAATGIVVSGNGMEVTKRIVGDLLGLLKPNPYTKKQEFINLLVMLYQIFSLARRDGLLGLESHLEKPAESAILSRNPTFLHNHHASDLFCDTLRMIVSGSIQPHGVDELMELDLDTMHAEEGVVPDAIQQVGDSMPAVGIVACVLGVIITMGRIGGEPAALGEAIAVALVGTMLGVMVAYVIFFPVVRALNQRNHAAFLYLTCIRHGVVSFAKGNNPQVCVEFARRSIEPSVRPEAEETELALKAAKL